MRRLSVYALSSMGVLTAMSIVLTRFLPIDLGFARFSLGSVPVIAAGLWFGPLAGALTGLAADLIGSFLQGYAPNPVITAAAMLWGVLPALVRPHLKGSREKCIALLSAAIAGTSVISTLGLTTAGLVMLGYRLEAIFMTRVFQFCVMTPVFCVLVSLLYFSPVTAFLSPWVQGPVQPSKKMERTEK